MMTQKSTCKSDTAAIEEEDEAALLKKLAGS